MPEEIDDNGAEVSDGMSENENECDDDMIGINDEDDKAADTAAASASLNGSDGQSEVKKKYDPKDPSRPKRKKARRACFACQKAHLTCGDERPCERCVRRGLSSQCQDGVRKKAKYLHDAPTEALRTVLGPPVYDSAGGNGFFSPPAPVQYPVYPGPPTPVGVVEGVAFPPQASPVSPTFQTPGQGSRQPPTVQTAFPNPEHMPFTMFDPSNPGIFNFDLESVNFGSQYGAMEWMSLGHLSSGAVETPSREQSIARTPGTDIQYGPMFQNGNGAQYGQVYDGTIMDSIMGIDQVSNGMYNNGNIQHGLPHAYAIANGPSSLASPPDTENTASPQPLIHPDESAAVSSFKPTNVPRHRPKQTPGAKAGYHAALTKKKRDASAIYESVKEPYSYVAGFHNLTAYVQKRFATNQTVRIAKALASIRPSFISCIKTLDREDLLMMEKVFQRTLIEHENFLEHNSSPAIVCRRTGEVVAVNNQFVALTGWTRDVLLGRQANQNVNTGGTAMRPGAAPSTTPRLGGAQLEGLKAAEGRAQPVLLAQLLDDDSVIDFYEDFSLLAFEDSRGNRQRRGKLLKYRTKETSEAKPAVETLPAREGRNSILSNRVTRIDGEHGISKLEKDGKMDCTYCWCIKRDPFDIPMMIVMNFLPCYYRNQEPHQLAV